MPFVTKDHRDRPDTSIPGDRCFLQYRRMMERWTASPRWTTIDEIASWIWPDPLRRAAILAFLVFFAFHGIAYERKKEEENGTI